MIIPRGGAGGFTLFRPDEDLENFKSRSEMFENIVMALGGRMAEKLFLDDISTGASNDIQQATNIARNMVTVYGMSEKLGPITYDSSERSIFIGRDFGTTKSYSEETAALIDEEVKRIFDWMSTSSTITSSTTPSCPRAPRTRRRPPPTKRSSAPRARSR